MSQFFPLLFLFLFIGCSSGIPNFESVADYISFVNRISNERKMVIPARVLSNQKIEISPEFEISIPQMPDQVSVSFSSAFRDSFGFHPSAAGLSELKVQIQDPVIARLCFSRTTVQGVLVSNFGYSFQVICHQYLGGAHPGISRRSFNFRPNGVPIKPSEVFKTDPKSLAALMWAVESRTHFKSNWEASFGKVSSMNFFGTFTIQDFGIQQTSVQVGISPNSVLSENARIVDLNTKETTLFVKESMRNLLFQAQ